VGKRKKWLATGLTSLGAMAAAGSALGSGFQVRENSAAALGNAFAGAAASAEDASTVANNPAGMTALRGNQSSGDLSIVIPSATFSGAGLSVARQPITGGNGGNAGQPSPCRRLTVFMTPRPM
jgi:long-chain fatty acid transport protein